jgi:hypothetical protein
VDYKTRKIRQRLRSEEIRERIEREEGVTSAMASKRGSLSSASSITVEEYINRVREEKAGEACGFCGEGAIFKDEIEDEVGEGGYWRDGGVLHSSFSRE